MRCCLSYRFDSLKSESPPKEHVEVPHRDFVDVFFGTNLLDTGNQFSFRRGECNSILHLSFDGYSLFLFSHWRKSKQDKIVGGRARFLRCDIVFLRESGRFLFQCAGLRVHPHLCPELGNESCLHEEMGSERRLKNDNARGIFPCYCFSTDRFFVA